MTRTRLAEVLTLGDIAYGWVGIILLLNGHTCMIERTYLVIERGTVSCHWKNLVMKGCIDLSLLKGQYIYERYGYIPPWGVVVLCVTLMCKTIHQWREMSNILMHCVGIYRGSFRKIVKRGKSWRLESLGGITSLVPTPHTVFTSFKGGVILANEGERPPPPNKALLYVHHWKNTYVTVPCRNRR